MKGYTIQNSINLLEKGASSGGGGGGGTVNAADVSYDNTLSGLTADDVQEAIDELDAAVDDLNTAIGQIDTGVHYSTTEQIIGTVGDEVLYRKMVDCGALPNATSKVVAHGISDLKRCYKIDCVATASTGVNLPIPMLLSTSQVSNTVTLSVDSTNINFNSGVDVSGYAETFVIIEYTKTAPTRTNKKK